MRNRLTGIVSIALVLATAACQGNLAPSTPAPRACDLAGFGRAPGLQLPATEAATRKAGKSEPLRYAHALPLHKTPRSAGAWSEAAPGWQAWRLWLRSEEARSVSVHLKPLALPAGAELWICSPDGTTRRGPFTDRGPNGSGELWSPTVPGPELWLEVLVPAGREADVELGLESAFAAFR